MVGAMADAKQELRDQMRAVRKEIYDRPERSRRLCASVLAVCEDTSKSSKTGRPLTVMAFAGKGDEPDTSGLLSSLYARGFMVVLPRMEGENLVPVPWGPGTAMVRANFGVDEPVGVAADVQAVDVVVVPGLAFTIDGHRLGQGAGYYDRFLPELRPDCVTIGLCYREQIVTELPVEEHDHILQVVVTDALPV